MDRVKVIGNGSHRVKPSFVPSVLYKPSKNVEVAWIKHAIPPPHQAGIVDRYTTWEM